MVTQREPADIQRTRDWLESSGAGAASTDIRQLSEALHPNDDPWLNLVTKSRIDPSIERDYAWIMAEAVADGEIDLASLPGREPVKAGRQKVVPLAGAEMNIATTFTAMKLANSIAVAGKGRAELVSVFTSAKRMGSGFGRLFRRGQSYGAEGFE